ncbi:hypothetical protein SLEP1_g7317 [Rubroshorea leprosula]|uniref:Uncharacterized protein n=1 Tax=Rubroshorea leprosula TaxID=152421 RepID=A0AAV5I3S8_9ROSI|nr:hypothetical protein SLEP1_g7317 [Rubroshorea leprosula]
MALFTPKVANVALVLILFMVVFQEASVRISGNGCFYANAAHSHNRKALADLKKNKVLNDSLHGSTGAENTQNPVGWELRTVPSGPDPLHQNGRSPKKPRTP